MVIERVELTIKPDQESAFEAAMLRAQPLLSGADGCRSVRLARGVENPGKYLLLLEWDAVSSHMAFTKTTEFTQFGEIAGPFFAERPAMEHFMPTATS